MVKGKSKRAAYTLEFKREAVRLVEGGQGKAVTAKVLGVPAQTLDNWLRHAQFDEPQRQLLGQRAHREPLGIAESRALAWLSIRPAAAGDG